MAANIQDMIDRLVSHAMASGYFDRVNTHEPKNRPNRGMTCAIWIDRIDPVPSASGLNSTTSRYTFFMRLYTNMIQEPQDMIDPNLIEATDYMFRALSSDFSLGGTVKQIDLLGATPGHNLSAQSGYINIDNTVMRVITMYVPVVVNNAWDQAE